MNDDAELLRRYAQTGADDAFATLVRRYLDLTWAAARRVTGDPDLARDVAQSVFADLARKARYLPQDLVLPAWLHRAAYLAACKAIRANRRRAEREKVAMNELSFHQPDGESPMASEDLLARLDEALASLGRADREALLLRFFPNRTFADVGARLGVNEEAARKRVARALEAQKALAIAKLNSMRDWGLAMIMYAGENQNQLPATLEAARKFLPRASEQSGVDDANVELIAQGRLADSGHPAQTILAREREPWVTEQGRLARTYVFVDGHSEVYSPPDGDFTRWESERGVSLKP